MVVGSRWDGGGEGGKGTCVMLEWKIVKVKVSRIGEGREGETLTRERRANQAKKDYTRSSQTHHHFYF